MSVFSDLVADVYTLTNRPELVDMTKLAVRSATLKAHQTDFYPKDLYETGIEWNPVAYIQSLEYRLVVPRWRAFKYLRKYDNTTSPGTPGKFFEFLSAESILDDYGVHEENVCYLAGEVLQIRSDTQDRNMLLGCYRHPDVNEATYSSWIALDHRMAIVYGAAGIVAKATGYDEVKVDLDNMLREEYALLKQEVIGEGY